MFTEQISLGAAHIKGITHRMKEGAISGRVTVRASFPIELARMLGCSDLTHLSNGAPRSSFEEIALAGGCKAFRAIFKVEGLPLTHEMDGDEAGEMVVRPVKDGLGIELRLSYHGDPLPLISYWMQVGEAKGTISVTPLQTEIQTATDSEVEIHVKDGKGHTHVEKLDTDTVRKAVLASGKKKWARGIN